MKSATVFNIQKFCVNDGPGIRTTVFLKGCPLSCQWCHNPESNATHPELFFDDQRCTHCGRCVAVCQQKAHEVTADTHVFHRERCIQCNACAKNCYAGALEPVGTLMNSEEVLREVLKDEIFYRTSGGGMTVSGGEPMAHFDFTLELLQAAKEKGLHTCMETCGFASPALYRKVAPFVDLFLYDYKLTDPLLHKKYTGVDNALILQNLSMLDAMGCSIILRCPIIPTVNNTMEHFHGIATTANNLSHVQEINIEPYHPLGSDKARKLGQQYAFAGLSFPEKTEVQEWITSIAALTAVPVKKG